MRTVKFTPLYSAGTLAGAGLALFMVYIFSQVDGLEFTGWFRITTGLVALLMLIAGGVWNVRLQSSAEESSE
jgi:high-affinity Fe2+/Pb2+ permease